MTINSHILQALAAERVADFRRESADQRPAEDRYEPSKPSPALPSKPHRGLLPARGQQR